MNRIIIALLLLSACAQEDVRPKNSTCIYQFETSTNAQDIGGNPYKLVSCIDNTTHQARYTTLAYDCNCPNRP